MAFMQSRMVQINPQVYALLQSHISDHISFKAKAEVYANAYAKSRNGTNGTRRPSAI